MEVIFYRIFCKDPSVKNVYVGQTKVFVQRKSRHKWKCKKDNLKVYETIRQHGGWDNWYMEEIDRGTYPTKKEILEKEQYWMDFYYADLNKSRAVISKNLEDYYHFYNK